MVLTRPYKTRVFGKPKPLREGAVTHDWPAFSDRANEVSTRRIDRACSLRWCGSSPRAPYESQA